LKPIIRKISHIIFNKLLTSCKSVLSLWDISTIINFLTSKNLSAYSLNSTLK
jgi:hypothetical protein